jgi:hypothetical protein
VGQGVNTVSTVTATGPDLEERDHQAQAEWIPAGGRLDWADPTPTRAGTSGFAIASFVLGFLWLGWIGSILALVFGYRARADMRRSATRLRGQGLATAGLVIGWSSVLTPLLVIGIVVGAR